MSCFENQILEQSAFALFVEKMETDEEFSDLVKMDLYTMEEIFKEAKLGRPCEEAQERIFQECLKKDYEQTIRNFFPVVYDMVTQ